MSDTFTLFKDKLGEIFQMDRANDATIGRQSMRVPAT